ncbi:MAG: hypothetical protein BGP06_16790 [Rhizobiales bacterium 65-9]|nr:EAL domain-containing protein [Hyphomicrobiales bacterium]OJY38098.1 MAG: hypothetical protein BGP06_16790 [Rhizobiales bacterium 65-9]
MSKTITLRAAPLVLGMAAAFAALASMGAARFLDASPQVAALFGLCAVGFAAIVMELRARRRQTERLADAVGALASGVERAGAQLAALDDRARDIEQWIARDARPGVEQSAAEIEMLGTLVKELAVAVAHHDAELGAVPSAETDAPPAAPAPAPAQPDRRAVDAALDRAIADGAFDLHLQPIVSLPQRRVKFYEAFARLRAANDEDLHAALQSGGRTRLSAFDLAALRRLFVVTRRLAKRNRDIAVFVRVSDRSIAEPEALISALHGAQDLASHIVILMSQATARLLGGAGLARLRPLVDLGFGLGVDKIADLRLDPRTLFDHGVRYVKAPAGVFLSDAARAPTEIDPRDLSRLLTRNGVQLIADGLDRENTVVEILDFEVRFGQGDAFSPPRPVKPDLLEPLPEPPVTPSAPAANDPPPAQPERVSYRSTLRRA